MTTEEQVLTHNPRHLLRSEQPVLDTPDEEVDLDTEHNGIVQADSNGTMTLAASSVLDKTPGPRPSQ